MSCDMLAWEDERNWFSSDLICVRPPSVLASTTCCKNDSRYLLTRICTSLVFYIQEIVLVRRVYTITRVIV